MGDGARAADVWVVSDKAVSTATLLPAVDTVRWPAKKGWSSNSKAQVRAPSRLTPYLSASAYSRATLAAV